MKYVALTGLCFLLLVGTAQAETKYIRGSIKITMRTGPGTDHKILRMLQTGQKITVVEEGEEWSKVKLSDELEGWVLTRFLTSQIPAKIQVERLKIQNEKLKKQTESLQVANSQLTGERKRLASDLTRQQNQFKSLADAHETLRSESADFLKLKSEFENTARKLDSQTEANAKLSKELKGLQLGSKIKWFLSGGGVFLLGYIIGFSTKRPRRRSGLL